MFATIVVALMLMVPQAGKPVAVPDTPQGKHVKAYLDAFNSGDEKKYLAMLEEHFEPATMKQRVEERTKMFQRLRGDFGTFKVTKVAEASEEAIALLIPNKEGIEATFTFRFATSAPFKINGVGVDIERGGR